MHRILVVIDSSAEANLALDHALDVADAATASELILLTVEPEPAPWEALRRSRGPGAAREILARAKSQVLARGLSARTRMEKGDKAETITRVAKQEQCDQIFVSECHSTLADRALTALAVACTGRVAGAVISSTGLPVTVVAPKPHS